MSDANPKLETKMILKYPYKYQRIKYERNDNKCTEN